MKWFRISHIALCVSILLLAVAVARFFFGVREFFLLGQGDFPEAYGFSILRLVGGGLFFLCLFRFLRWLENR